MSSKGSLELSTCAIDVRDVTKTFGKTVAARNISLRVEKGEFFSFLGPSGCGKTTVLRMLAGFESPTSGQILIDGNDVVKMPAHKRPVNMVFQSYALFPHLSVLENICFGLQFGKIPKSEIIRLARRALALVRLEHLESRYPVQLSGGQQQRIALARAIVKEPSVLLLDEPLSALDPQIREEMQSELSRLQRELNMTFVMVTHDQNEALALSHRIAVFCAGNLEQVDVPRAIYSSPKTKFVAQFIGHSNVIPCTYVEFANGVHRVKLPNGEVFGAISQSGFRPSAGEETFICVKPQAIALWSESQSQNKLTGTGSDQNWLRGQVRSLSYKGTSVEYFIEVGDLLVRADAAPHSALESPQSALSASLSFNVGATWLIPDSGEQSGLLGSSISMTAIK